MSASDHLGPQFGTWYHGTTEAYEPGHVIDPSQEHRANWQSSNKQSVYFTSSKGLAAEYSGMLDSPHSGGVYNGPGERYSVYRVEPTGPYQHDANHPDEPSYETAHPLRVVGRERSLSDKAIRTASYDS